MKGNKLRQHYSLVNTVFYVFSPQTPSLGVLSTVRSFPQVTPLFSPTVFDIFLERIMAVALEDHDGTVSIGGRTITNLRFADDIDGLAGQEQELVKLVNHLEEASTA